MFRKIGVSFLSMGIMYASVLPWSADTVYASSYEDFYKQEKSAYDSFLKMKQAEYAQYLADMKTAYDGNLRYMQVEYNLLAKQFKQDYTYVTSVLNSDYAALEKKYGNNRKYRDALRAYRSAINPDNADSPIDRYEDGMDPNTDRSPIDQWEEAIDPNTDQSPMDRYEEAVDPGTDQSPMDLYEEAVDPGTDQSPMDHYEETVDPGTDQSPMDLYEEGRISEDKATDLVTQQKTAAIQRLEQVQSESTKRIEEIQRSMEVAVETTKQNTIQTLLNQRKLSLDTISALRKKHFGKGISLKPLSVSRYLIKVKINHALQIFNQPPVMTNGNTYVPMRDIFQKLGATVTWNAQDRSITAQRGDTTIFLKIGSRQATRNGTPITLDAAPQVINKTTMVPLRFIGEALGAQVSWRQDTRTVEIVLKK